ncbi:MAG: 50S ribosomal protein L25 [Clostridia bacterium]|nr:50S ribosomal protein L25 [Clostridia bacterium]
MKQIILEVSKRETKLSRGKLNALRKEGLLPGIIYGREVEPIPFTADKRDLIKIIGEHGANAIITVKVDSGKPIQTMIKEVQKHPISGLEWHLDLGQISMTEVVRASVPIVFEGEPKGVAQGGFVQYGDTTVEVECLPMELPQNISIDISEMEIGDRIVVGDLKLSGDITILSEAEQVLISVVAPTLEETDESEATGEVSEATTEE